MDPSSWVTVVTAFLVGVLGQLSPKRNWDFIHDWPGYAVAGWGSLTTAVDPPSVFDFYDTKESCIATPSGIPGGEPTETCREVPDVTDPVGFAADPVGTLVSGLGNVAVGLILEVILAGMACLAGVGSAKVLVLIWPSSTSS
jgi:hypothetical protein